MARDHELVVRVDHEKLTEALDTFSARFTELTDRVARVENALREYDSHFDDLTTPARSAQDGD